MQYRPFGRTGWQVSAVSFGAWAIGADWGPTSEEESMSTLHAALDAGINLFDTADKYGDGRSERLLARLRRERSEPFYVITKIGRRITPHEISNYSPQNLIASVDHCLKNTGFERLDLVQLHCPHTGVYYQPEVFATLDELAQHGKIQYYGVSVSKVEEGIMALEYPNMQSVQIIFNMFRQRPKDLFFRLAQERRMAVLARVPLSSGLLTGKMTQETHFPENDHRQYNRQGDVFDRGETFSGIDFETSLEAVEELKQLLPTDWSMAQFALRWILMHEAISCTIPGAKRPDQVRDNASAADLPPIPPETMQKIEEIYSRRIKTLVHYYW